MHDRVDDYGDEEDEEPLGESLPVSEDSGHLRLVRALGGRVVGLSPLPRHRTVDDAEDADQEVPEVEVLNVAGLEGVETFLMDLEPCNARNLFLWFHLMQPSEEDFGLDYINPDPWDAPLTNAQLMHWQKFNDWPSWALMKDIINFSMEFDLWLMDP